METTCPECGFVFQEPAEPEDDEVLEVACPSCRAAFYIEEEDDGSIGARMSETGEPARIHARKRKYGRYIALLLVVAGLIAGVIIYRGIRESALVNEARNTAALSVLRQIALAQEDYYLEYNQYASDFERIKRKLPPVNNVRVRMLEGGAERWSAAGHHVESPDAIIYRSYRGGVGEKGTKGAFLVETVGDVTTVVEKVGKEKMP